jgi:hypothetical protein
MSLPDRQEAFDLLCEHTENPNLIKHMVAVEGAPPRIRGKVRRGPASVGHHGAAARLRLRKTSDA